MLKDAIIGSNPRPLDSRDSIRLLAIIDDDPQGMYEPIPINNDDWSIITQNIGSSGYAQTTYELSIENADLNID